jgi:GT2 family glycosyltransferase
VIPTWNRRDLLERLLVRLREQTHPIAEILVVDNGSTDGSAESAESMGARVIRLGSNLGFSRAVNRGIQESRTEWLAIVNNDVEPAPEWMEKLISAAGQPGVWFATGKMLRAGQPDSIDGTFDLISRAACPWRAGSGRQDGVEWNRARSIRFAPFTAALFRAELFKRMGLLDETLVSYLEDVDFGLRCALAGCPGVYVPDAVAYHQGSATRGVWHKDTVRQVARNQVLLVRKYYQRRYLFRQAWPIVAGQLLWGLVALRHGAGVPWLQGKLDGIRMAAPAGKPAEEKLLSSLLEESEREIEDLQKATGYDWYWRLYFALT